MKRLLFFKSLRHQNAKSASIVIIFLLIVSLLSTSLLQSQDFNLDGCYHVYLDVGTNVGIQIRKLYEPEKYPDAKIHRIFDEHFKRKNVTSTGHICAIGCEPNPRHVPILQSKFEKVWKSIFFSILEYFFRIGIYLPKLWMECSNLDQNCSFYQGGQGYFLFRQRFR